ncbi:MAG: hypothetical protein HZB19_19625 [Chloroflexi bacterium]|nr:hypothetical protein [Chloroflexota bacterium]
MLEPKFLLTLCGIYNLGFAVFHLFFWRIFKWKEDLASLTHVNRSVMQILNLRLTYMFLVMAYVSFVFQPELTMTKLGQTLLIAFSVFWFMRTVEQVVFFGLKHKVSNGMTVLFFIGGVLHLLPVF